MARKIIPQIGTDEQSDVFISLQKLLMEYFTKWPDDTAIAVFASAMGSVCGVLEVDYNLHRESCDMCQKTGPNTLGLFDTFFDNFEYYYNMQIDLAERDATKANELVADFFKKGK